MTELAVWLDRERVGRLCFDATSNRFAFDYAPGWLADPRRHPLSPALPLEAQATASPDSHSAAVRQFFENLLPEGEALDHAAQANGISKANLVGLMLALGKETAGAIRIALDGVDDAGARADAPAADALREVPPAELSMRIRRRAELPFSVWDGRVRLSIAGYQDKIAVYERDGRWFLVEGSGLAPGLAPSLASTRIVKPQPQRPQLACLPDNEFFCMALARRVGLDAAVARLVHVPEPVLFVERFDRIERAGPPARVQRLHLIDGCQALGLSAALKYERPYGDGRDVRAIRDGASLSRLFGLLEQGAQPARDRLGLLRWAIFQVLIGNTDAHGKNVSFFFGLDGLRLAPAYDLVCVPALGDVQLSSTFAMAIGDAFAESELTPFEWASFAQGCGLPRKLVAQQLQRLAVATLAALPDCAAAALGAGADVEMVERIVDCITPVCERQRALAPHIAHIAVDAL